MNDVVICEPIRTPVGRQGGALASLSAVDLASTVLTELVRRTGLGEGDVDDVVLGQCYANGESPAIGRIAALDAGLGTGVPGLQIDRRCGSGLQAVLYAAGQVATGAASVVVAGGAESMSQVEHYALGLRTGVRSRRHRADGPARPGPRDRGRPVPPGPGRHDRDGREPPRGVRHLARGAGRAGGPLPAARRWPPRSRAGSPRRSCRSPCPGSAASPTSSSTATSTPDRAPPWRTSPRLRPLRLGVDDGVDGDRRQRERPERRRRDVRGHHPRRGRAARPAARCSRCGRGPSPGWAPR